MNYLTEEQEFTDAQRMGGTRYVWECAIGGRDPVIIPPGGDLPMRQAVERAFFELTGQRAEYTYSGWGRKFTEKALTVFSNKERTPPHHQPGGTTYGAIEPAFDPLLVYAVFWLVFAVGFVFGSLLGT
jgi:hypothetical protein